jgi:Immunoglobulin I-set domain
MRTVQRALARAVMTALVAVAVGPVGVAMAEPPTITIDSPINGSVSSNQTPSFSGTTNDVLDEVTLNIYQGTTIEVGTKLQALPTLPVLETWSTGLSQTLAGGVYTAQAVQTYALTETGVSNPPVTFTVDAAPVVTEKPADGTAVAGEGVMFTAAASGTPTPEVQWQVLPEGGSTWTNDTTDPGNNTDTLTLAATTAAENGNQYRAVFTNIVGTATSTPATLTVNVAPVVTTHPSSKGVKVGEATTFTAAASGTPTPTVQWQVSADFGETWTKDMIDTGNNTDTLTVTPTTVEESGYEYRAVFTNVAGSVKSAPATLTVAEKKVAPVVTNDPPSSSVTAGQVAVFTASASGIPTPEVQWQVSQNSGATWTNESGPTAKTGTLAVSTMVGENGYEYRAVFTNSAGHVESTPATLTVNTVPVVTLPPASRSVLIGETATFTAAASGRPTPTVQWQESDGHGWTNLAGATTDTLTLAHVTTALNDNEYRALFTNSVGHVESASATLTVAEKTAAPLVTTNPASKGVKVGEATTFTAAASGVPTPTVQWQVSINGGSTWMDDTTDSGNNTGTLTVAATTVASSGQEYRAVFTNAVSTVKTLVATLTVTAPAPAPAPEPTTTPALATTPAPSTTPSPSPPVASFQWFPSAPHVGEPVSLVSTSTDATSPITAFAWSLAGNGAFNTGAPALSTSFSTPGSHVVMLRVTDANGLSSVLAETIPVTSPAPTLMQPFPVVRIAGSENASGVKISLLTVQAPVGATVTVTCHGPGCPSKPDYLVVASRKSKKGKSTAGIVLIAFRRFERSLRAGVVLEIRVSAHGQIGKYTRFAVRHGKLPARVDMCLSPAGIEPIVCPSS